MAAGEADTVLLVVAGRESRERAAVTCPHAAGGVEQT